MYPLLLTYTEESVPKSTNLYNMHVLPNRECQPGESPWVFLYKAKSSYFSTDQWTALPFTSGRYAQRNEQRDQRCHGTRDPQQQIVIRMLWYQWGIVCKQTNVQIVLLNFSLYYEWFKFYNPLLFSLHPTSLSNWKSQLILRCPSDDPRSPRGRLRVTQQTPSGNFPCQGCRHITAGSPAVVPPAFRGRTAILHWATCVFFPPITPKIPDVVPRVAERSPASAPPASEFAWSPPGQIWTPS